MIEVKDLVKSYGGHMAVDHLSFTVRDGQIYGFLGPNGAGKSTTMNIMTGYLGATSGEVLINGHNILEEPEAAKSDIGYLPEMPPLYTDMTVREYLDFAASLKKIPRASRVEAVAEAMELVKVADVNGRLIKNLSKGYRQRVGMAQAILGKPQVIILDEPTVGLDPKQIIEIRDMIRGLGKKHTVILSSHILSEVSAVCDHILIINRGKLIASDTPENLERQMAGAGGMNLSVKGSAEDVRAALETVPQISGIHFLESSEEGVCQISLDYAGAAGKTSGANQDGEQPGAPLPEDGAQPHDVREAVFYACADRRLPILAMVPVHASLEEVFLELTEDEKQTRQEDCEHESDL